MSGIGTVDSIKHEIFVSFVHSYGILNRKIIARRLDIELKWAPSKQRPSSKDNKGAF